MPSKHATTVPDLKLSFFSFALKNTKKLKMSLKPPATQAGHNVVNCYPSDQVAEMTGIPNYA